MLSATRISSGEGPRHTYSGIGVYQPELFAELRAGPNALAPLLRTAAQDAKLSGELYLGDWLDVGTPERLDEAALRLRQAEGKPH